MESKLNSALLVGSRKWGALLAAAVFLTVIWFRANPHFFISGISYLSDWKYTHFLFNYDDGFVKRGLIGDLVSRVVGHVSYEVVNIVSYLTLLALALIMLGLFSKPWRDSRERVGAFLLMLIATSSPATLQHFAYDVGRFDIFIYIALSTLVFFLVSHGEKNRVLSFFIMTSALTLMIFIHEAAFFMVIPMVIVAWYIVDSGRGAVKYQVMSFVVVFSATFLVSIGGAYSALPLNEHLEHLNIIYGSRVVESSLSVIHNTTLEENISRTINAGISMTRLVHHAAFAMLISPLVYLIYKMLVFARSELGFRHYILILSALSPVALYPLGHDHFRWWSLAITNLFVVLVFLCIRYSGFLDKVCLFLEENKKSSLLVITIGFISGPLGITRSFDVVGYTVRAIRYFL